MGAVKGIGTTLTKTKSGTELVDLPIADLTSIGSFGVESEEIDVTTLDSAGGYREYIPSLKDSGEISLAGMVKSNVAMDAMWTLADSQSLEEWTIEFLNGDTYVFDGFVKSWKVSETAVDGVYSFEGSIRISGPVVYTPAVGS